MCSGNFSMGWHVRALRQSPWRHRGKPAFKLPERCGLRVGSARFSRHERSVPPSGRGPARSLSNFFRVRRRRRGCGLDEYAAWHDSPNEPRRMRRVQQRHSRHRVWDVFGQFRSGRSCRRECSDHRQLSDPWHFNVCARKVCQLSRWSLQQRYQCIRADHPRLQAVCRWFLPRGGNGDDVQRLPGRFCHG